MASNEVAVFGGGCFWCTEAVFQRLKGVVKIVSGYAGGNIPNPSYERVTVGTTGHAEVIEITFDPSQITYQQLLSVFFVVHDPTTLNQQDYDKGTIYRSILLTTSEEQNKAATKYIAELTAQKEFEQPIVTEVKPLEHFYPAEEYHQNYYNQNSSQPYCQIIINPKLEKLFKHFPELLAKTH